MKNKSVNIKFQVNGKDVRVGDDVDLDTRLSAYIRDTLHLTGTKVSCGQGGCGACCVTVNTRDKETGMVRTRSINSVFNLKF